MIFTETQRDIMTELAGRFLADAADGPNPRDAMAPFFAEYTGTTLKCGRLCMVRVKGNMERFHADYQSVLEDPDRFFQAFDPTSLCRGSSIAAHNYWLRYDGTVTVAATAVGGATAPRDRSLWALERILLVPVQDASPQLRQELREQTIESIKGSGLLLAGLAELPRAVREWSGVWGGRVLVDLGGDAVPLQTFQNPGSKKIPLRWAAGALAAAKSETGEFEGTLPGMHQGSPELLWSAAELLRTIEAVGKGETAADRAIERLCAMSVPLVIVMVDAISSDELPVIKRFNRLAAIPRGVAAAAEVLLCTSRAAEPMLQDSRLELSPLWVDLETAAKGAEMAVEYAQAHVIPQIVARSTRHLERLLSMGKNFAARTQYGTEE